MADEGSSKLREIRSVPTERREGEQTTIFRGGPVQIPHLCNQKVYFLIAELSKDSSFFYLFERFEPEHSSKEGALFLFPKS